MAYRIEVKPQAEKALARIPNPHRRRIAKAIDGLARIPRPAGCVKLTGADDAYRIRVGDYRIVYEIADRVLTVYVAVPLGKRMDPDAAALSRAFAEAAAGPLHRIEKE